MDEIERKIIHLTTTPSNFCKNSLYILLKNNGYKVDINRVIECAKKLQKDDTEEQKHKNISMKLNNFTNIYTDDIYESFSEESSTESSISDEEDEDYPLLYESDNDDYSV